MLKNYLSRNCPRATHGILRRREHHGDQLYPAVENIDRSKTRARSPQLNGICERFYRTLLEEFCVVVFRKNNNSPRDELQADLDKWLQEYNELRPHSGRHLLRRDLMQTSLDSLPLVRAEMLNQALRTTGNVA